MDINFFQLLLDPQAIIKTLGFVGIIVIVFLETGAFFGFFLPGDSLLFTAGFLASQGLLPFSFLLVGTFISAVAGDSFGYAFGKKIGPKIFSKEDSVFFSKKNISRAEEFYNKHGKKTIILARFMPVIRTFAPILAGVAKMEYRTFLFFNIIGAFVWTWGMLLSGYALGSLIPDPDKYILPVVGLIIIISAFPVLKQILKGRISLV
jgi:membrane-associated protein